MRTTRTSWQHEQHRHVLLPSRPGALPPCLPSPSYFRPPRIPLYSSSCPPPSPHSLGWVSFHSSSCCPPFLHSLGNHARRMRGAAYSAVPHPRGRYSHALAYQPRLQVSTISSKACWFACVRMTAITRNNLISPRGCGKSACYHRYCSTCSSLLRHTSYRFNSILLE